MSRIWVTLLAPIACAPRPEPPQEQPAEPLVRAEWHPHQLPMDSLDMDRGLVARDELLGVTPVRDTLSPKTARLLKRLRRIEELPPADQRVVLKLVDAMLDTRRRSTPTPRSAKRRRAESDHPHERCDANEHKSKEGYRQPHRGASISLLLLASTQPFRVVQPLAEPRCAFYFRTLTKV